MQRPARITRIDGGPDGRLYGVNGKPLLSVTNITGIIDKPQLVGWAASRERVAVTAAAVKLLGTPAMLSAEAFSAAMVEALGKEKEHTKLMERAADIGTAIHAAIENDLRGDLELPPKPASQDHLAETAKASVAQGYAGYLQWKRVVDFKPTLVEKAVYSFEHEYAGTMDVLGVHTEADARVTCVGDWKSSRGIYFSAMLQIAAYRRAVLEMGLIHEPCLDDSALNGLILRLPKTIEEPEIEPRFIPETELDGYYFPLFLHAKALWHAVKAYDEKYPYKRKKSLAPKLRLV